MNLTLLGWRHLCRLARPETSYALPFNLLPGSMRAFRLTLLSLAVAWNSYGASGTVVVWGNNSWGERHVPPGLSNVVAIAAGGFNTLALKQDGTVVSWGRTNATQTNLPAGLSNVVAIDRSASHCLALKRDGTVIAWGSNTNGQTNVPLDATNVIAIAAGEYHSLALKQDGTAVGWGGRNSGSWVINPIDPSASPVDYGQGRVPAGATNLRALAAGGYHSLALKHDGTVVAWGIGGPAAYINGTGYGQTNIPSGLSNVVAIAAGGYHSLALKSDGTVVAWGAGANPANNGVGYNFNQSCVPSGLTNVVAIAAGNLFSLALKSDGSVVGWGNNSSGQISIPSGLGRVAALSGGWFHSVALVNNGPPLLVQPLADQTLFTGMTAEFHPAVLDLPSSLGYQWQFNGLDLPRATNSSLALTNLHLGDAGLYSVNLSNASGITTTSARLTVLDSGPLLLTQPQGQVTVRGAPVTLSVAATGSWPLHYQWQVNGVNISGATNASLVVSFSQSSGDMGPYRVVVTNAFGTVISSSATVRVLSQSSFLSAWGLNTSSQTNVPTDLKAVPFRAVAGGVGHSLALKPDGTVAAWGTNNYGQTNIPLGLASVTAIAAGAHHNLALQSDGTVVGWGAERPLSPFPRPPTPPYYGQADVPTWLANVTAIAAGQYHSLALQNNGVIRAWGDSTYGQTNVPAGLSNVVAIAAGYTHNLALKSDGTVAAWGYNSYGQTTVPAGLSNVVAIAAGAYHSLALKRDGTLTAWGANSYGQINLPAGLTNVVAMAAGQYHTLALKADGTLAAWGLNSQKQTTIPSWLSGVVAIGAGASHSLAVTRGGAPFILRQPISQTLFAGLPASFSVGTAGAVAPQYQWQLNGTNIAGATTASLTVTNAQLADAGDYMVVVSNAYGIAVSAPATLTVLATPPLITAQPLSQPFLLRSSLTLGATVIGPAPLAYQWQFNGIAIPGATNATLVVSNAQLSDAGNYTLVVSNAYGSTVSSNALLTQVPALVIGWGYNAHGQTNVPRALTNAIAIAAGASHSLALRSDGTVMAWGTNSSGQLSIPPGLSNVVAIAAGANHNLALRSDGIVTAWGDNTLGQTNVPAGLSNVVAIGADSAHSIALKRDGTVITWGWFHNGPNSVPAGLSNVVAIGVGYSQNLAVQSDGSVVSWIGHGLYAPVRLPVPAELTNAIAATGIGYNNLALRGDGTLLAWGTDTSYGQTNVPADLTNVVAVEGGDYHGLALKQDGTVAAWGAGTNALYSSPHYGQARVPAGLSNVVAIAAGTRHSLALVNDGSPLLLRAPMSQTLDSGHPIVLTGTALGLPPLSYQWQFQGTDIDGATNAWLQLANAQPADSGDYTLIVSNPYGTVSAAARLTVLDSPPKMTIQPASQPFLRGATVKLAPAISGSWPLSYQWFFNSNAIPDATNAWLVLPNTQPGAAGNYVLVASNAFGTAVSSTAVLAATHSLLVAWGDNGYGQTNVPCVLEDISAIAAGSYHSLALTRRGKVFAWGAGASTNGGVFDYGQAIVPDDLTNVIAIATKGSRSLALQADGTLRTWGASSGPTNVPPEATNLVAVAAGGYHNLALRRDGKALAWSTDNSYGQANVPPGLANVTAIAAGADHNLALRKDGTIAVWGGSYYGQTNQPQNLSNVVAIAAGDYHSLALKSDGTVVAWGNNSSGQSTVPRGLSNVVAIAGGTFFSLAIRNDGTLIAWGDYEAGQTNIPVGLAYAVAVGGGSDHGLAIVGDGSPFLVRQPMEQEVFSGTAATFSAMAVGSPSPAYQWQFNGADLPGATNTWLTLPGVRSGDGGSYTVVALNSHGAITSSIATLTVLETPPIITHQPLSQLFLAHSTPTLSIGVTGPQPVTYQWQFGGDPIEGATNAWLALTNAQAGAAGGYSVIISNAFGAVTSAVAVLQQAATLVAAWGQNTYGQTNVPADLGDAVSIAAGQYHSLALHKNGTVSAWGAGQTYTGTSPNYGQARIPANLTNVVAIAAGWYHSLALQADGRVVAWGYTANATNVPANLTNVVAIAGGLYYSLALKADGTLAAWGENTYGQLNVPSGLSNVVAIAAGGGHALALNRDGTLAVWGDNAWGQTNLPAGLTNVVAIAAGWYHNLALKADGTLVAWGLGNNGQTTIPAGLNGNVLSIAAGAYFSMALRRDGSALLWGDNSSGQTNPPLQLRNVIGLAGGYAHGLALLNDGSPCLIRQPLGQTVYTGMDAVFTATVTGDPTLSYQWQHDGTNLANATAASLLLTNVQLADAGDYTLLVSNAYGSIASSKATLEALAVPPIIVVQPRGQALLPGSNATLTVVATGSRPLTYQWQLNGADIPGATNSFLAVPTDAFGDYTVVLSNSFGMTHSASASLAPVSSFVLAWGSNLAGQTNVPAGLFNVQALAAGDGHNLALLLDHTVVAWGINYKGQTNVPPDLTNAIAVAAGWAHSMALKADGTVAVWGYNEYGQTNVPAGLSNVVAIAAGSEHCLALKQDGTVLAWGSNLSGQRNVPQDLTNVVAIAGGVEHSLVLKSDGSIVGWGYGVFGKAPLPVGLTNVVAIASGGYFDLALKADGTVVAWGFGSRGETNVPPGLTNVVAISGGNYHAVALKADGTVVAWGFNQDGQTSVPAGLTNAVAIQAGDTHNLALVHLGSPYITRQPASRTINSGMTVEFGATVLEGASCSYQWQFNGAAISGATNASLSLTNVPVTAAGNYSVRVSNLHGSSLSSNAVLTVLRSFPQFANGSLGIRPASGSFGWQLTGLSGHGPIVVYASTNLEDWTPIFTNPPITGTFEFLDLLATNQPARFYHAEER